MVWDVFIALYLFLAGLGAGAFVLGALTNWVKEPVPRMKKIAFIIAPIAVAVGTLVLVLDAKAGFSNPLRFFLLISNLNSIMSWGVIILSAFLVVSIIDLIILFVKKSTPKVLDIIGMVLAVCVAAYTGVLLGDAHMAFPLWSMAILPVLFVVSAASSGFAAVVLGAYAVAPKEVENVSFLPKTSLILPALELVLVVILLVVTATVQGSAAEAAAASVGNLMAGSYAIAFWGGLVLIGIVLPFGIELYRQRQSRAFKAAAGEGVLDATAPTKTLAIVGEAGVLIGGFMLRYLVIMAAVSVVFA